MFSPIPRGGSCSPVPSWQSPAPRRWIIPTKKSWPNACASWQAATKSSCGWRASPKRQGKRRFGWSSSGTGAREKRRQQPALLAVAGIEGNDLAGSASLLAWTEQLASDYSTDPKVRELLDSTTLYVFPRLNPEAAELFFAKPKLETEVNSRPVDEDHDGLVDEDGPNDLDADGRITWMRVQDPEGDYIVDPQEGRLLMKADRAKGEAGGWRFFREGRDDDHDEAWNEDGKGGVNLNRNFPYNYRFFAPGSGRNPVSEPVTRKLADFVVAHPNIGIVFTFGAADNLVQTPKGEPAKRPPTAILEDDLPFYRELGKSWREALGLKKELTGGSEPGSFSDWMYFHRGRLSLAARAWSPALQLELSKTREAKTEEKPAPDKAPADSGPQKEAKPPEGTEKKGPPGAKPEDDKRNEEDRAFLKWADQNWPEAFVPWKLIPTSGFSREESRDRRLRALCQVQSPGAAAGGSGPPAGAVPDATGGQTAASRNPEDPGQAPG